MLFKNQLVQLKMSITIWTSDLQRDYSNLDKKKILEKMKRYTLS